MRGFCPPLKILNSLSRQAEIVQGDALQISPDSLTAEPYRIISNLPYNIATRFSRLVGKQLARWRMVTTLLSMTCMFQKEVAQRIAAARAPTITGVYRFWQDG
ncbi:MAG: hypothetical protein CM15mP21_4130 [Hyphomicrobiales bacterium]|nr:MAG: hypothetical protein CM15mP21_4130 [Hyphomicrobiales bacterium]